MFLVTCLINIKVSQLSLTFADPKHADNAVRDPDHFNFMLDRSLLKPNFIYLLHRTKLLQLYIDTYT